MNMIKEDELRKKTMQNIERIEEELCADEWPKAKQKRLRKQRDAEMKKLIDLNNRF